MKIILVIEQKHVFKLVAQMSKPSDSKHNDP